MSRPTKTESTTESELILSICLIREEKNSTKRDEAIKRARKIRGDRVDVAADDK